MRKSLALVLVLLTVLGAYFPHITLAKSPSQYTALIEVDIVDVKPLGSSSPPLALVIQPLQVPPGTPLRIKFHAIYPSGEPVTTLDPVAASFGLSNSTGMFKTLLAVPVVPTSAQPGNYTYDTTVTSDFPNGPVTVSVLAHSLSDAAKNFGPPSDVDSALTLDPYDNSTLQIGIPTGPPQPNYQLPAIIAALVIIALLLFLARRRKRKK